MLLIVYAHNISCWDCVSLSGLEKFLDRDSLSQIVINHGSRGGWIEVAPRSEVKIRPVTLRLKRLLHGCVDNLRRTRLMCEVMSCDKRGKAGFTSVKHFRHFFWTGIWVVVVVVFFFLEREGWITPAHGHRRKTAINWTETRSLHSQHYLTSFFLRARVSVSLVPGRSLLIRCPREVSVTSQRMVESRNDRAENAWGLGWGYRSASLSPWIGRAVVTVMHMDEMTFLVQNKR